MPPATSVNAMRRTNNNSSFGSTHPGRQQHPQPQPQPQPAPLSQPPPIPPSVSVSMSGTHKNHPPVVVAALQQQHQPSHHASTTVTPTILNPSYNGIALSPCRQYGILSCIDTIQIVHISALRGIELIKTIVVTPYFQQQQQQQHPAKGLSSSSSSTATTAATSYLYPSTNSASLSSSSVTTSGGSSSFLNLRDFALGGGTMNKNATTPRATTTIQPPIIDTQQQQQLIVVSAVAWSCGGTIITTSKTATVTTTNTNSNNETNVGRGEANSADSDSVHSKTSTTATLLHNLEITDDVQQELQQEQQRQKQMLRTSMIAVAGSNGVIVIWDAASVLSMFGDDDLPATSSNNNNNNVILAPAAILNNHHVRQVNALAFHPTNQSLLLSASQDCTVIVWEQRKQATTNTITTTPKTNQYSSKDSSYHNKSRTNPVLQQPQLGFKGLFGAFGGGSPQPPSQSQQQQQQQHQQPLMSSFSTSSPDVQYVYTWHCRTTFKPNSEAIRDVQWSPIFPDVFALVTASGALIVYNQYITARVIIRISAHSGDASTIHWHPTQCNVIATGGDRSVKIWNFEREFEREFNSSNSTNRDDVITLNMERNASTSTSRGGESVGTNESSTVAGADTFSPYGTIGAMSMTYGMKTFSSVSSAGNINTSQHRKRNIPPLHVLTISAAVTRIRWRPVANVQLSNGDDWHSSMIAVSTAPIKGTNAGGVGSVSLWTFHRPYMPLSIVEGHQDGTITDFDWLETPQTSPATYNPSDTPMDGTQLNEMNSFLVGMWGCARIWQHVISVGRDGNCLVQSLVRGDRPISRVPPSCFAMANLSPFQKGYGSLQLFSVCQPVSSDPCSDVMLTALRRDQITFNAPGIFRELPLHDDEQSKIKISNLATIYKVSDIANEITLQIPRNSPEIHFNVIDQGVLDEDSNPMDNVTEEYDQPRAIIVAPELVHVSRFAQRYKFYIDSDCPTRIALCQHNGNIAASLSQHKLAYMWNIVCLTLKSCITSANRYNLVVEDDLILMSKNNTMIHQVFLPMLKELLVERANAGDVQTCVALCEVFELIQCDQSVLIQDLEIEYIREWYLSYIDLLRDMCLFSYATYIIKHCRDPIINALNQQSTIIHESCPHCGKVMLPDDGFSSGGSNASTFSNSFCNARRVCKNCRRRVGLCFLCHEPVKGVYVWCPGCGHGGHLEHALQWFGGGGDRLRTMCPTGCGHQCNLMQQVSAFPRTESFT